jgi:membrane associated rhomboid family serine protease
MLDFPVAGINYAAHLGGAAAGFILGPLLYRIRLRR